MPAIHASGWMQLPLPHVSKSQRWLLQVPSHPPIPSNVQGKWTEGRIRVEVACSPRRGAPEVHVPRGVDEVERIHVPVGSSVPHARLIQFDGDPPLPLQIHAVQELRLRNQEKECSIYKFKYV